MNTAGKTKSAAVRERLKHPVVDADGHFLEVIPVFLEYLRDVGGPKVVDKYRQTNKNHEGGGPERVGGPKGWYGLTPQERRDYRVSRSSFWSWPTANTLDRATVTLPNLFRERLDELGIDFALVYGTVGLGFLRNPDEEQRRMGARAFNIMCADLFGPHADRMTPAAAIPMHTPQEALDELDHAVNKLGLKVAVFGSCIRRPIAEVMRRAPEVSSFATWMDVIGLSSDYDYDPVWQKCVDLKIAVTTHANLVGWGARTLPDSWVYNHIGHFGQAGEAFCKALVIGGVVQRFPTLRFAFLEGGVGWACSLYNDLIEHWEKRNIKAIHKHGNPDNLDLKLMEELFAKYGGKLNEKRLNSEYFLGNNPQRENTADLDEWRALKIDDPRDFSRFFKNFYFGCESDDRIAAFAFNPKVNHYGAKLNAIFSSDVGHFDVPDITAVVAEAYELVEDGLITEADFRDFTFGNTVKLHGSMNPDFFKGTSVEHEARAELGQI